MGHLVNPISFRLGKTFYWNFVWSSFLKKNYRYLALQDIQFMQLFNWLLSLNTLYRFGIFFSHFKIYRLNGKLIFFLYFIHVNKIGFGCGSQSKVIKFKKNKKPKPIFTKPEMKKKIKVKKLKNKKISSILKSKIYKAFIVNFYNQFFVLNYGSSNFFNVMLLFLKRTLSYSNKIVLQKKLRLVQGFNSLLKLFVIVKWYLNQAKFSEINFLFFILKILTRKKKVSALRIQKQQPLKITARFLTKVNSFFFERRVLFIFEFLLSKSLDYLNKKKKNSRYIIFSKLLDTSVYKSIAMGNSFLVARTLIDLMKYKKYSVKRALEVLISELDVASNIVGFKIALSGRLSRSRRGMYLCKKDGKISLNTIKLPIDYTSTYFKTKFGICGVKVWLNKNFPVDEIIHENKSQALFSFFKNKYNYAQFQLLFRKSFQTKAKYFNYLTKRKNAFYVNPDFTTSKYFVNTLKILKRSSVQDSKFKRRHTSFIF
jgi:hypothetical protein